MNELLFQSVSKVLCLGAHSDDIEIGCGGTILELVERKPDVEICWVVFSAEGERRDEARKSAEQFAEGCGKLTVKVLQYRESYFPDQWAKIKEDFENLRKEVEPDLIFTHCRDDRHQDHRVLSDLTWNTFRNHLILEYEIPKYDGDLGQPNTFVPVSESVAAKKVEFLMKHFSSQSQRHWFAADVFLSLMRLRGTECALRYAEAFYARKAVVRFS